MNVVNRSRGSTRSRTAARLVALAACCALGAIPAFAEEPQEKAPEKPTTGLPEVRGLEWTFHLDASFGAFGFANSLYTNPKPGEPSGDLSDNWFEGTVKPGLSATYTAEKSWQAYGKFSVAGEGSYGTPPTLVGDTASSFLVDDLYVGWRSGKTLGLGENALDFTVGRAPYQLGHGFLVADGTAEGGSRGGYWSNVRKAYEFAAIGRFKPGRHAFEAFYLVRDELPEAQTHTSIAGANYELALGESTTLGASFLRGFADPDESPTRDGLDVVNVRAYTAPFSSLPGLAFEGEYAREWNGDLAESTAYTVQAAYELKATWKPRLSYRYAFFQGDDPGTAKNEGFDPLFPGFYDWGTWWQGEIAGEYFLSNSNLISHQVRLHSTPMESLGTGLIFYQFLADRSDAVGPGVTSKNLATELDWYADWKVNDHFTISPVLAWARPGDAVEQATGRNEDFWYGMFYGAYSY
jgi:hypothetical protein